MPAWGCCKPFYDPFYRHEKYDGKLYEVDRGRRRGLHLYLHRIYFYPTQPLGPMVGGRASPVVRKKQAR